ncbi:hypothetical protein SMICM304S_07942 [Streptomyces microflavus]
MFHRLAWLTAAVPSLPPRTGFAPGTACRGCRDSRSSGRLRKLVVFGHQVDALGARCLCLDHTARHRPWRVVESGGPPFPEPGRRGRPDLAVLVRLDGLHQHLEGLADALLGPLRGQLLGQLGRCWASGWAMISAAPASRNRPPRCPPGRSPKTPMASRRAPVRKRSSSVGLGLTGEPDDEVGPGAGLGGLAPDGVQELQEAVGAPKRRIVRSTLGEECWKERSKYGATFGVEVRTSISGADLGGLEVADPDPLDAVHVGQLRQQGYSRSRMSPRSLPSEICRNGVDLLDAPARPAGRVSWSTSEGRREMKEPRKEGMAQKEQRQSRPGGELSRGDGAGAEPPAQRRARSGSRYRWAQGRSSGAGAGASWACPGSATAASSCRSAGLMGSSQRWRCSAGRWPRPRPR